MILVIDNYDSFTFNVVQLLGSLTSLEIQVFRNDQITVEKIRELKPQFIVISPGPGRPSDAGISCAVIGEFFQEIPLLGICLGHQCLAEVFGGKVHGAERILHGKTSQIFHGGKGILNELPSPFTATRYHSLIVSEIPDELVPTCYSEEKELMGIQHASFPVFGVQFHPESFLTLSGAKILENFLQRRW